MGVRDPIGSHGGPFAARYLEVRYEDLLARPDRVADVFAFLGLACDASMLRSVLREGNLAVNVDPTRPEVASGKWRGEWSARDLEAFDRAAGDVLAGLDVAVGPSRAAEPAARTEPTAPMSRSVRPRFRLPKLGDRSATAVLGGAVMFSGETAQRSVDRLLTALSLADAGSVHAVLCSIQHLRVVDGDSAREDRGPGLAERVVEELLREGGWGDPVTGEQHIDGRSWTLVVSHRRPLAWWRTACSSSPSTRTSR